MNYACNVCDNPLRLLFPEVSDPVTGEQFSIWKCSVCGLGCTVPQPEELSRYYGEVYYGRRHSFTSAFCIRRRLRFVATAFRGIAGKTLLDVGCGDGSFLLAAQKTGWQVTGVEINPAPARAAGLHVETAVDRLPPEVRFDCITLWHSLEHFRDIRATLLELSGRLNPGGKLLIAVPDNGGLQARVFKTRWLHLDVPRHLYHFDAGSLSRALECAGFKVERQWHQELEYDWLGWSQSWMNCFFPIPNFFFNCLAGKQSPVHPVLKGIGFVLGLVLTVLCLPAQIVGTLLRRGGTLVAAASLSR